MPKDLDFLVYQNYPQLNIEVEVLSNEHFPSNLLNTARDLRTNENYTSVTLENNERIKIIKLCRESTLHGLGERLMLLR